MINYPNRKKVLSNDNTTFTNQRGMALEKDLNDSNLFYVETNVALIYKKPTPIQVVKVDYPKRSSSKIIEAYYKTPSTTDYNGIYRGKYIDFEAKETKSKSLFSFKNIHPHQIKHLRDVLKHGGIAFMIIRFTSYQETYLIEASHIISKYEQSKSISYTMVQEIGHKIKESYTPRLRYLDVVNEVYFKED